MEFADALVNILNSTIRVSVPLLLACLAGLYSERAGVFDIGLEGKMLAGAFAGAAAAAVYGSAWIGLGMAVLVAVALALVHGFASITHRGNQIVSGVAINFIAAGSTIILGQAWFSQGGRTPSLPADGRFGAIALPFADELRGVPVIGQIYSGLLSGHTLLAYAAFLAVPFTWWVLFRTRFGLRLRAVGENPAAVDTAGISVTWLRYRAVICTGILTGLAGCYLALSLNAGFVKDMTAGRGYIALAALIFAKWRPVPAMFACLLFGFLDAISIRLQGRPLAVFEWLPVVIAVIVLVALMRIAKWKPIRAIVAAVLVGVVTAWLVSAFYANIAAALQGSLLATPIRVPVQFMQALPYVLTVILLAGFIGKAIPPRAGGVPYVKER
jgi:simple sugar transport system permease protein